MDIDFKKIIDESIKLLGKVNILVSGKTGVGKSTLINAVFKEDIAETGVGKPVTQYTKEYSKQGCFHHIWDTKGFELAHYKELTNDINDLIKSKKTGDPTDHIHIMWYCVSGTRFEVEEYEFVKTIAENIPVIIVCTQSYSTIAESLYKEIKDRLFNTSISVIRVLAMDMKIAEDYKKKAFGVKDLVNITYEKLPEAAKGAFAAAQQVNKDIKKKKITGIIACSASLAIAAGANPIPFSDALVLAPIQIGMLASIGLVYGLSLEGAFLATIVSSAAGVVGATYAGRAIVAGLIKLIPVGGTLVGGMISASIAGALTTAMGWAYYNALELLISNGEELSAENISSAFVLCLKSSKI